MAEMDLRGSSWTKASGLRVSAMPPEPTWGPPEAAGAGAGAGGVQAGAAAGAGAGGVHAGAGAAAAGAGAGAAAPPSRCLRYSSKEGAAEMDLRGSSCSKASGLRVSAMPPEPTWGPLYTAVEMRPASWGLKAAAPATRAEKAMIFMVTVIERTKQRIGRCRHG